MSKPFPRVLHRIFEKAFFMKDFDSESPKPSISVRFSLYVLDGKLDTQSKFLKNS